MNSTRGFYKLLIFVIFVFIFLVFLPQTVLAGCWKIGGSCPSRIAADCSCTECGDPFWGLPDNRRYCHRSGVDCNETYICTCDSDPCGGGGCFVKGTEIKTMIDGQWTMINDEEEKICKLIPPKKGIEELKEGDTVVSFDEKGGLKESRVANVHKNTRDHYYELETEGGYKVEVTGEHPFFATAKTQKEPERKEFIRVEDLQIGDIVFVFKDGELKPEKITRLERIRGPTEVYNLTVEGDQTFFANSFAVHNKGYVIGLVEGGGRWQQNTVNCGAYPTSDTIDVVLNNTYSSEWKCNPPDPVADCSYMGYGANTPYWKAWAPYPGGSGVTLTLTPPAGYDCDYWQVWYPCHWGQQGCWPTSGSGCTANIRYCEKEWAEFATHLWFFIKPSPPIAGHVKNSITGAGIGGVEVQVYDDALKQTRTATTDNAGYWKIANFVRSGDFYAVRVSGNLADPQTAPSGYVPPAKTTSLGWNWNYCVNPNPGTQPWGDTPPGSLSYECQRAGSFDCAGLNGSGVTERCDFAYTPATGTITGNVYQNLEGRCTETDAPTADWSVTCKGVTAREDSTSQYTCKDSGGSTLLPFGVYEIDLVPPAGWRAITGEGCLVDPVNISLISSSKEVTPPFYIWQGARAWFQTEGGDSHAQGNITSYIPQGEYFCKDADGYPGVVSYGGDYDFFVGSEKGEDRVSSKGWLAETDLILPYNFTYFYQKLGSPTEDNLNDLRDLPPPPANPGETQIFYSRDLVHIGPEEGSGETLTIPSDRKIIVLVGEPGIEVNAIVTGNIEVIPGGFLAVISSGRININETVSNVQGMYVADGHISTGSAGEELDSPFRGEGVFYSPSIVLARSTPDAVSQITPAELFIFRPDLLLNAPKELRKSQMSWQEVAP